LDATREQIERGLCKCFLQAFRPIDRENFYNFVENHLGNKNLLTNSQYEECLRIVNGRTTRRERVRSVEYVPFDIVHQDIVVFESCPPTPFAPEPILEIPRRPVILDYTKCDGCKKVEERLENIEYIDLRRKNSIIYEEEQFKDIIKDEQFENIIQEEQFNDIIQEEQFEDVIQETQFEDIIDEPKITESKWSDVEEEQMFNVWIEGKVSNDKNLEDNDEDEIEVVCKINKESTLKKMRNTFKRKNFTVAQVRNSCFFSNSRPMKEEIEDFLNNLTNEGILMKNPKSGNKESWSFTKK
jgi:ASC-1-like (ASCH) protein